MDAVCYSGSADCYIPGYGKVDDDQTQPPAPPTPVIRTVFQGDLSVLNSTQQTQFKDQVKEHIANRSGVNKSDITVKLASGSIVATATLKNTVKAATVQDTIASLNSNKPTSQIDEHAFPATVTTYHETTNAPTKPAPVTKAATKPNNLGDTISLPINHVAMDATASDTYERKAQNGQVANSGSGSIFVVMAAVACVAVLGMVVMKAMKRESIDHGQEDKFQQEQNDLLAEDPLPPASDSFELPKKSQYGDVGAALA